MQKILPQTKRDIQSLKRWLGISLLASSFALYGCLLLVPFLPSAGERKIALSAALIILGEGAFWLAVFLLGREAIAKYREFNWRERLFAWLKGLEEKIKSKSS